ncbi:MAG: ApaG domain [Pseudomonadota bacterium]|nr:ApaG domain [Pseudomonadota bacterium]
MLNNFDYSTMQTGDIVVSACQELLEKNESRQELWGYVLRIENNSDERIRLMAKDVCITDAKGNSRHLPSFGFNGELPDLEPGECFEYEETAQLDGISAVIYGYCKAVTTKGKELNIKLPVLNLSSSKDISACLC